MQCTACGHDLRHDATRCPGCGQPAGATPPPAPPAGPPPPIVDLYAHSGRLGNGLLVPLVGAVLVLVLAPIYSYIDVYNPILSVLSALLVLGYGALLGAGLGALGRWAKVRSPGFMAVCGLVVGVWGLYAAWAAFEAALVGRFADPGEETPSYLALLVRPDAVWRLANLIGEKGWFTIGSSSSSSSDSNVSGVALWLIWAVEAGCIVVMATVLSRAPIAEGVFCESCDRWCEPGKSPVLGLAPPGSALPAAIRGEVPLLPELEALPPVRDPHAFLLVELRRCAGCRDTASLLLKQVKVSVDAKGRKSTKTEELTPTFLVGPDAFARLEVLKGVAPPAAS